MSDYIKREDALEQFDYYDLSEYLTTQIRGMLMDVPSADVAPVRHGHWRLVSRLDEVEWLYGAVIECSQCKHKEVAHYNYCPNCGAKMDGGENDV